MDFVMNENNFISFLSRTSSKAMPRQRGKLKMTSFLRSSARKLFPRSGIAKRSPESSKDKDGSDTFLQ
jgi:hypothetical protein